ncbi:peptidoglycan-binding protein [Spirillospora sp. NPDC047279]|uniref:peptidoglycan-binding protein n=1 Tax=Spirillospora sp. NPDC047279 TaxID=3155478 RepID=UPI0033DFE3B3
MKRVVVAAVVVVVAGGSVGVGVLRGGEGPVQAEAQPLGAASVERGDLVDSEKVDGTLTYEGERGVALGVGGVATAVPEEGRIVKRGEALLKVNGKAVTLFYGSEPMYRVLKEGVEGRDVEQLERNLEVLGYGGLTVDQEFTGATADAVREWQDDRGLEETGVVEVGQVVFLSGAVRVKDVKVEKGGRVAAGQVAVGVTGLQRVVRVDLDAEKQDLARQGARVEVELPGGVVVRGTVAEVGDVAQTVGEPPNQKAVVAVEIRLDKGAKTGKLDQAPVTVELESERTKGVLSVPVEALLALKEGGFGVEVVEGAARRVVAVKTGAFGGGRVEVEGAGLKEGMKVGVPVS